MDINYGIAWLITGAITGWIIKSQTKSQISLNIHIIGGLIGGIIGGAVSTAFDRGGRVTSITLNSFTVTIDSTSIFSAFIGAVILQIFIHFIFSARRKSVTVGEVSKYQYGMFNLARPREKSILQTVDKLNQSAQLLPSVFISYRRIPSAMLATLIAKELEQQNIQVFVDTRQQDGAGQFPNRLLTSIENNEFFVCLVADTTFESAWVLNEIEYAHKLGKTMIPVFQESYNAATNPPNEHIDALLQYDGIKLLDRSNLYVDEAIAHLVKMIKGKR